MLRPALAMLLILIFCACNTLDEATTVDMGLEVGNENSQPGTSGTNPPDNMGTAPLPGHGMNGNASGNSLPDDSSNGPMDPMGGSGVDSTAAASAQCTSMCEYLDMCGSCFYDDVGNCLDVPGCAAVCDREVLPTISDCVGTLTACDEAAFQNCYDQNVGDDDCANTCRFLDECGECFFDEYNECLSIAGCALVCRMSTPPATATCIAQLDACDGIGECFEQ